MEKYEKETKRLYQNDKKALEYHREYTSLGGLRGLRFRFIALMERKTVAAMLAGMRVGRVLDAPCGTGKMAPILIGNYSEIVAGDISPNMLKIAKDVYGELGFVDAQFDVIDLEKLTEYGSNYDIHICFRLMHRLPNHIKRKMLSEMAKTSKHAIVSFGLRSLFLDLKHFIKSIIFQDPDEGYYTRAKKRQLEEIVGDYFEIIEERYVSRYLSSQIVFKLKSKLK